MSHRFTFELARRIRERDLSVLSVAAHPGYAATNLQQRGAELSGAPGLAKLIKLFNPIAGQSAAMGALPQLYAATASDVVAGDYIGAGGLFGARGYPKKVRPAKHASVASDMRTLWEKSEQLTSVRYEAL